jgi:alpha/beta superfamily hydrolase
VLRNTHMVRADRLPPPPQVVPRSPAVAVAGEVEERIAGLPGNPSLEARAHAPAGVVRAIVLCHPHPLYGGSMHSPVPLAIAKCLADHQSEQPRVAWLRFNFRGVGTSEGSYADGQGEVDDVCAAIEHVRRAAPGALLTVCGHSFGSFVGLRATARDGRIDRLLLISPSTRFFAFRAGGLRVGGKVTVFVGDKDELCSVDEARALADELGADLGVFEGFDHHFMKSRRVMAEAALSVIAPEGLSQ